MTGAIFHPDDPEVVLFSHKELACRSTGVVRMAPGFAEHLVELRVEFDNKMIVTSGGRSKLHNDTMTPRGHPRSLHVYDFNARGLKGFAAVDVKTETEALQIELAQRALAKGWSVGVYRTWLHIDRRDLAGLAQQLFPGR